MITLSDGAKQMDAMELFRSPEEPKPFCRCDSCGYMRRKGVQVLDLAIASLPARGRSIIPLYVGTGLPTYCPQCEVPMRPLTLEEWLCITIEVGGSSTTPHLSQWSPVSTERYQRSVKIVDASTKVKEEEKVSEKKSKPPALKSRLSWLSQILHVRHA